MKDYDSTPPRPAQREGDLEDEDGQRCPLPEPDENEIWDGSEAEFIAEDDTLAFEEPQTGIKLEFTLKYEEVVSFLKSFPHYQKERRKIKFAIWLLSLISAGFLGLFFAHAAPNALIIGGLCAVVVALLLILPGYLLKSSARALNTKDAVYVEIYPDNLVVGKRGKEIEIPLDGSCEYQEFENLFLLFPPKGEMLIIPIRAVEPDFLPDVQAMLLAGTTPKELEV